MSLKLDAVAYGRKNDYGLRRLEETILILHSIVTKTFHSNELQEIYNKHIEEIRKEINDSNTTSAE